MWGFHTSLKKSDLVKSLDIGRKTTVHAHDLALDNSGQNEVIEDLHAVLPGVGVSVLAHVLIEEAVDGRNLARLVVTSQDGDMGWVLELQAHKKLESFN